MKTSKMTQFGPRLVRGGARLHRGSFLAFGLAALEAGMSLLTATPCAAGTLPTARRSAADVIVLPAPRHDGSVSVEAALFRRRSARNYQDEPLRLDEVRQLLWAAQGVSNPATEARTAPSAGALYPLELSILVAGVEGVAPGFYRYQPAMHALISLRPGGARRQLAEAALGQGSVADAAAIIVLSGVYERTTAKYGERGVRYVHLEAGHAAQNVYLQAAALGLGTVVIGAFDDVTVRRIAGLADDERPLYLMPIGRR